MLDRSIARLFAYGIFRNGEIAFPNIEGFVEKIEPANVAGHLLERDGIHLLVLGNEGCVEGDLIHFADESAALGFAAIDALEPNRT